MLTLQQIEKLASRKGVKRIAVENFLMSLESLDALEAYGNLDQDTRCYKWNTATRNAIGDGIKLHFASK